MVAVTKPYQGQGYMRQLLETALEEGRKHAMPVVLDTDAVLKKAKYEHLGMRCVTTQHVSDGVELYGMVYEPDTMPKEWAARPFCAIIRYSPPKTVRYGTNLRRCTASS